MNAMTSEQLARLQAAREKRDAIRTRLLSDPGRMVAGEREGLQNEMLALTDAILAVELEANPDPLKRFMAPAEETK